MTAGCRAPSWPRAAPLSRDGSETPPAASDRGAAQPASAAGLRSVRASLERPTGRLLCDEETLSRMGDVLLLEKRVKRLEQVEIEIFEVHHLLDRPEFAHGVMTGGNPLRCRRWSSLVRGSAGSRSPATRATTRGTSWPRTGGNHRQAGLMQAPDGNWPCWDNENSPCCACS